MVWFERAKVIGRAKISQWLYAFNKHRFSAQTTGKNEHAENQPFPHIWNVQGFSLFLSKILSYIRPPVSGPKKHSQYIYAFERSRNAQFQCHMSCPPVIINPCCPTKISLLAIKACFCPFYLTSYHSGPIININKLSEFWSSALVTSGQTHVCTIYHLYAFLSSIFKKYTKLLSRLHPTISIRIYTLIKCIQKPLLCYISP